MTEKWYQPKTILNGIVPPRYNQIEDILSKICKGKKVADIGCNAGVVSLIAAKHGASKVIGLDKRDQALIQAQRARENWIKKGLIHKDKVEFINSTVLDCYDKIDNFDVYIFLRVLYHIGTARFDEYNNNAEYLFSKITKNNKPIIIMQGNLGRKEKAKNTDGEYGNKLAMVDGMERLAHKFNLKTKFIPKDIIIAS